MLGHTFAPVKVGEVIGQARLAGTVVSEYQRAVGKLVAIIDLETSAEGLNNDIVVGHIVTLFFWLRKELLHETFFVGLEECYFAFFDRNYLVDRRQTFGYLSLLLKSRRK